MDGGMAVGAAGVERRLHVTGGEGSLDRLASPPMVPGVTLHAEERLAGRQ